VDAHHFSDGIVHAKELLAHGSTDYANIRGAVHIILRKNRTLVHVPALNFEILRRNTAIRGMPVLVAVDDLHWVVYVWLNAFDQRNLILDGGCVGHDQSFRIVSARTHAVYRTATCFDPDKIVTQVVQLLLDARLACFSDCDDTNHRGDPNRDAEDR